MEAVSLTSHIASLSHRQYSCTRGFSATLVLIKQYVIERYTMIVQRKLDWELLQFDQNIVREIYIRIRFFCNSARPKLSGASPLLLFLIYRPFRAFSIFTQVLVSGYGRQKNAKLGWEFV